MSNQKSDILIGIEMEFDAKNMGGHKAFLKKAGTKVRILHIYICYSKNNVIGDKKKK
jgi:hypothetical protein